MLDPKGSILIIAKNDSELLRLKNSIGNDYDGDDAMDQIQYLFTDLPREQRDTLISDFLKPTAMTLAVVETDEICTYMRH